MLAVRKPPGPAAESCRLSTHGAYGAAATALAHWSQDFYPELGEQLLDETGIDPAQYAPEGRSG